MNKTLYHYIYENFDRFIPVAAQFAVPTAAGWGAHRNKGGMLWATYKAACRRNGVWSSGASGPENLNADLFEPLQKQLATGWERAFRRGLPSDLDQFSTKIRVILQSFHREAIQRSQARQDNYHGLQMLAQQLEVHFQRISDLRLAVMNHWQEQQRDANRGFIPIIEQEMMPAYNRCVEEYGPGSFKRMKDIMVGHVSQNRKRIFVDATWSVRRQLEQTCHAVRQILDLYLQDIYTRLSSDYLSVLVGTNVAQIRSLPRVERLLRTDMVPVLAEVDKYFGALFGQPGPAKEGPGVLEADAAALVKPEPVGNS